MRERLIGALICQLCQMQGDKIQAVHVIGDARQLGFLSTQLGSACHLPFGGAILTGAIPAKKGIKTWTRLTLRLPARPLWSGPPGS